MIFGEWDANFSSIKELNYLLEPYYIELGYQRYSGDFSFGVSPFFVGFSSGSSITKFPKGGFLLTSSMLNEVQALQNSTTAYENVAIFGYIPHVNNKLII